MKTDRSMKVRIFALFMIPGALLLMGLSLLPQQDVPSFDSLTSLLLWVAGAGGIYLAGKTQSYLMENWPAWHNLPYWVKALFPIFLSGLFGIAAQALIALNVADLVPAPLVMALLAAINYYGQQENYKEILSVAGYGKSARAKASGKELG